MRLSAPLVTALFLVGGCSDKKSEKSSPEAMTSETMAPAEAAEPTGLPDGPHEVARTPLERRMLKSRGGETREWRLMRGIEVVEEDFQELYTSRGSRFVGFKARVKVGEASCLIDWKAELVEGARGRGPSIAKIAGTTPARAGTELIVSGVVALSPQKLARLRSASAGYWTLCGDALPRSSALDVEITDARSEQLELGSAYDLHHTVIEMENRAEGLPEASRCYFELVAEDVDARGYTLNRDFASYSLPPGGKGLAKIRRTSFEGGSEKDFEAAAVDKRTYIRHLSCREAEEEPAKLEGIAFEKLELRPYEGKPTKAEHLVRASFGHSAIVENTLGKHCSFRVRYRLLDEHGLPINRAPLLSETLHLKKGAAVSHRSEDERLYVWRAQAEEVASLVVEKAGPIADCTRFDPERALSN